MGRIFVSADAAHLHIAGQVETEALDLLSDYKLGSGTDFSAIQRPEPWLENTGSHLSAEHVHKTANIEL